MFVTFLLDFDKQRGALVLAIKECNGTNFSYFRYHHQPLQNHIRRLQNMVHHKFIMSHLNANQKSRIKTLTKTTEKTDIGKVVGCSRQTVYNVLNKHWPAGREEVSISSNRRKKGNSYTNQDVQNVISFFNLYPFATFKDCKNILNLRWCINTIRTILHTNNINTYYSKRKPYLDLNTQATRY